MRGALQVYQLKFELEYPEHAMTHFSRRQSDDGGRRRWLSYNDRDGLSNAMVERRCNGSRAGMRASFDNNRVNNF